MSNERVKIRKSQHFLLSLQRQKNHELGPWHTPVRTLANAQCSPCMGAGVSFRTKKPCHCVTRSVFDKVMQRYAVSRAKIDDGATRVKYNGKSMYLIDEEFSGDVVLVSRRAVGEMNSDVSRREFSVILEKFMLQLWDWKQCVREIAKFNPRVDRGSFFHQVYRLQSMLGKKFVELQPHPLYPLDKYFDSKVVATTKTYIVKRSQLQAYPTSLGRTDNSICRDWSIDIEEGEVKDPEVYREKALAA